MLHNLKGLGSLRRLSPVLQVADPIGKKTQQVRLLMVDEYVDRTIGDIGCEFGFGPSWLDAVDKESWFMVLRSLNPTQCK